MIVHKVLREQLSYWRRTYPDVEVATFLTAPTNQDFWRRHGVTETELILVSEHLKNGTLGAVVAADPLLAEDERNIQDWRFEVANGDTFRGLDDWRAAKEEEAVFDTVDALRKLEKDLSDG